MKKVGLISVLFIILTLTGCGFDTNKNVIMDKLDKEGYYHYTNIALGFGLYLPAEFEYYHVQRKNTGAYVDIEFFVPTADRNYHQEVQSYAKPVVVRIWNNDFWNDMEEDEDKLAFNLIGENKKEIYTIKFWETVPNDWEEKWSNEMRQNILDRFEKY